MSKGYEMKTIAVSFGFFILSIFAFNDSMAQKANYTTAGGLTIGIGGGAAYQKSDVANSKGFGLDLTLGSQLYRRENSFFSVDWKFRFLAGQNKAFDHRINPDDTYSNIRYSFFTYDLELGLTLNRLRERTGIVLTGFAGAGLTHGRTFTDLFDAGGNPYDFSIVNPDRNSKLVYEDLVALSDGDFETRLDNKLALLPTAGIFAGYQISRSLTLGIEFKTNFYLTEDNSFVGLNLDNKIMTGSGIDRNNYVSVGLRWNLRGGSSSRRSGGTHVVQTSTVRPTVHITEPSTDPYRTGTPDQIIQATIYNVNGPDNIRFSRNGFPLNDFTYNERTNTFIANVRLREGENSFRLEAINAEATVEDRVVITLENPPEVATIAPWDSYSTSSGNHQTTATHINTVETTAANRTGWTSGRTITTFNEPVYYAPANTAPVYTGSVYTGTVYTGPVNTGPVQNQPVTTGPVRNAPVTTGPVQNQPVTTGPVRNVYNEPVRNVPVYNEPVRNEPVYNQTGGNRGDHAVNQGTRPYQPDPESGDVTTVPEEEVKEIVASSIRFNPGNSDWQFCLETPSGTFTRENLTNSDFSYSGAATSLFFMPIGGGGDAMVNGSPYALKSGQYYHFTGRLNVTVSTQNPGSMGHWSVFIVASSAPVSGNGNNRPKSPCEESLNDNPGKNNANNGQVNRNSKDQVDKTNNNANNRVDNSSNGRSNNTTTKSNNSHPVKTSYSNPNGRSSNNAVKSNNSNPGSRNNNSNVRSGNNSNVRSSNNNAGRSNNNSAAKSSNSNSDKSDKGNIDKSDKSNSDKTDKGNPDKTDKGNSDKTDKGNPDNGTSDKPDNRSRR